MVVRVSSVVMVREMRAGAALASNQKLIQEMITSIPVGKYVWMMWNSTRLFITIIALAQLQCPA